MTVRDTAAENPRRRLPRGTLTTERIVDAALELAQEEGLDAVSMPKLAGRLGCGVMTIYGRIDDKDQLLGLLCARILAEFPLQRTPGLTWEEVLRRYSNALRERMLEYPSLAQMLVERKMWGPQVADLMEWILTELTTAGWSLHNAVQAFRAVQTYTLGFVLYEIPRTRTPTAVDHESWWQHTLVDLPTNDYPVIHAAAQFLPEGPTEGQFHWGLATLIDGLRAGHEGVPA
ncbi:TetR family transcriptional regulator [Nocardia colli]|uniref:TetR family transcriptional regulator n=1 Tax=Nocardia colli TaxID=2545717 RepID=A0A5N0DX40_9NOCA|nr:TetR/AcrR family transcriptional regulator C-terminal domain-containing protein [Nocardia colli]KAA8880629.1 TetR family transcriptional regulator [Nocardia colli]